MQGLTDPPRDHLTDDQVVRHLRARHRTIDRAGVELLTDGKVEDISHALVSPDDAHVRRDVTRAVHGTCELTIDGELAWGRDELRLYTQITADAVTTRWNLGVYLPLTPPRRGGTPRPHHRISGYDRTVLLDEPPARTVTIGRGDPIMATVVDLLAEAGAPAVQITGLGDDVEAPNRRTWLLDEHLRWRAILDDLCDMAGWQRLWCDWDGAFRSHPLVDVADRPPAWQFSAIAAEPATLALDATLTADLWAVPNQWVFITSAPGVTAPTLGNGIHVVDNVSDGPTSQQARGRVVTATRRVDAASQTLLVEQAERIAADERRVSRHLEVQAFPAPLLWHDDVVEVAHPYLDTAGRWSVQAWRYPLGHQLQQLTLEGV